MSEDSFMVEDEGRMKVNLSGVEEQGGFEAMPRGNYPVVVDNVEFGHSQSSGNPMWTWTLEVSEGEYQGRKLFYHTVFTDKAIGRVKKALRAVGAVNLLEDDFDPEEVADNGDLAGLSCLAKVAVSTYEGEKRNNVKDLLPIAGGGGGDFV